jgi:hypothetical protein
MPQPDAKQSSSPRSAPLVVVAGLFAIAGAALGGLSGTTFGFIAAVLCLAALIPLGLLMKSFRSIGQEAEQARLAVAAQRAESERNQAAKQFSKDLAGK